MARGGVGPPGATFSIPLLPKGYIDEDHLQELFRHLLKDKAILLQHFKNNDMSFVKLSDATTKIFEQDNKMYKIIIYLSFEVHNLKELEEFQKHSKETPNNKVSEVFGSFIKENYDKKLIEDLDTQCPFTIHGSRDIYQEPRKTLEASIRDDPIENVVRYENADRRRSGADKHEQSRIKKMFVIFPQYDAQQLEYVRLRSATTDYEMEKINDVYTCRLTVPDSFEYTYSIKHRYLGWIPWTDESKPFKIKGGLIQRDLLNRTQSELRAHLSHIIVLLDKHCDKKKNCSEIETVCREKIKIKDKLKLITDLVSDMDKLVIENMFPIAIVIGNIYEGKDIVSLTLHRDKAKAMADHLRTISLKDLTTSCCDYMPAVCHRLYQIAFPNKSSCVSEITFFSDFFGDNINLYIDICMGSKDCQMVADGDDVADFVGLCNGIGRCHVKFGYDKYSNHLKELLKYASLSMIVEALKQDLDRNIQDHIYTALQEHITEAIKVYSVEELYSCWRIIHQNEKAKEEFQSRIEEHVIKQLLKLTTFEKQTKALLGKENGLFTDKLMQVKLINSLLSSRHTLPLFIYLHRVDKFKVVYALLDADNYITCLEWTRTHLQSRGDLLEKILYIMGLTDGRRDVHDKVVEYFINNIKGHVNELLEIWETYDSRLSKYMQIEDAFIRLFREALDKDKRSPLELLQSMTGRGDKIEVNSSCAVRIIATVLEVFCPLKEYTDDISTLSIVMQNIKVWHIIFTCTGDLQHDLHSDPTCVAAHKLFRRIINMTEDESLTYAFSEKVLTFKDGDIETLNTILQMISTSNILSIKAASQQTISRFHDQTKKLQCVINVLQSILKNNYEMLFPCRFDEVLSAKEVQLKNLPHLNLSEKNCNDLWGDTGSLYHLCSELETATQPVVFWNVNNTDTLNEIFTDTDVLSTKHSLSAEISAGIGELIDPGLRDVNMFLKSLLDVGIYKYKTVWKALDGDSPLSIGNIKTIFRNALDDESLKKEDSLAKQIASLQLDQTLDLLKLLIDPSSIRTESQIIALVVGTFGLENEEFKQKVNVVDAWNSQSKRFHDVKRGLRFLFDLKQNLSEETFQILRKIGSADLLIKFLRKNVDEDIRNLIDAFDDISEQYVLESTVSELIEVQSFMQPLIQSKNAEEFLSAFELRIKSFGQQKCKGLVSKLNKCKENLHQLKSLYENVANRGEQTKKTIQRILSEGQFTFTLSEEVHKVSITCDCKDNAPVHSEPNLVDLRSRALLLMNSERAKEDKYCSPDHLRRFVEHVDLSLEIKQLVTDLFNAGHMDYFTFTATRKGGKLLSMRKKLHDDLHKWLENLEENRRIHFLLNFVQGIQIHYFAQYIASGFFEQKIEMILKFILPLFSTKDWKAHYDSLDPGHKLNALEFLENLGRSLKMAFDDNKHLFPHQMLYDEIKTTSSIQESVQKGRLLVVNLHENSVNVVKTVLALYENTTKCLPEPFQVLFCCKDTTWEEIYLLIKRCINSKEFFQEDILYCLANVELLPNEAQFRLAGALHSLPKGGHYLLSVVCRGGKKHLFIDEFAEYVNFVLPFSDSRTEKLFQNKYPDVMTVSSEVAGLGKSNYIKYLSHASKHRVVTLHISGKLNKMLLIQSLNQFGLRPYHSLHIDIANVDDIISLDTFLFELMCLRYVTIGTESYNLETKSIYIEVANTSNDKLRNSLQTAMCFKRQHLKWENFENFVASTELNSSTQVVCLFLDALEKRRLDDTDIILTGTKANKTISANRCQTLLAKYVSFDDNLSFVTVNSFLRVFADQLKKLSCSLFFKTSQIDVMAGKEAKIKSELVKKLMNVSKEFATRSIKACNDTQQATVEAESPIGSMIRFEDSNHLIYVFHSQNIQTLTAMYRHKSEVPDDVKCLFERQMGKELQDYNQMNQDELQVILQKVSRANPLMLKSDLLKKMSSDYALTPDNLLKMALIFMRIRARVPVVVMGETGCGKTSLIRYLARICEVPFDVMNIHAGTSLSEIVSKIEENDRAATKCLKKERWLFLDEINTSGNLNLISNIICHHTLNGKTLSPNLVILSACNPYKVRSEEAIYTAGLKAKVKTDEMSKLVYRVLPLPQQLVDYVWDFGVLSKQDERKYIHRMVNDVFPGRNRLHEMFVDILSMSQELIRNIEASYNVSLRDVQRCRTLTKWFCNSLKAMKLNCGNEELRAIILGVAHCYISRLASRDNRKIFREKMEQVFRRHKVTSFGSNDIDEVIVNEQKRFLSKMKLPSGTAQNHSLQENVFMILVCILNRIPIFIVGKPGCSKSLAMQVIRSNLRGKDSKDDFFKTLPQIYCVSFQGSESSTSDGILKVFEKAERYQQNNKEAVLSVVVLDEVGLAEVSRFNPLKVLHTLLEPGESNFPNIAVVGISNWALDASKMNRAIHLSRPDMTADELYNTGISISQSFQNIEPGQKKHDRHDASQVIYKLLKAMADAYADYSRNLVFKNFHGLRDYYALIKYVANRVGLSMSGVCVKSIVQRGLERNFGGLPSEKSKLYDFFKQKLEEEFSNISSEVKEIFGITDTIDFTSDKMPVKEIIFENIKDVTARHLLLIISGQSIFGILEEIYGQQKYEVMFGSQFEEDLTDDFNYRVLGRIILCMEEGGLLILKDLDTIYGSLYDMLNQNYTIIGQRKNCRIALGHYSNPICRVDDTFRCIVLVDETKLDYQDPPFLNRFEKQMLRFRDILGKQQEEVIQKLECWIKQLSVINEERFDESDLFPIYSRDLLASLVMKLDRANQDYIVAMCKSELVWIMQPDAVLRFSKIKDPGMRAEAESIKTSYFEMPIHGGLEELHLWDCKENIEDNLMRIIFTYTSVHTNVLQKLKSKEIQVEDLGAFKSEKQLSSRMQQFWIESRSSLLYMQCSVKGNGRHLMHVMTIIERFRKKFIEMENKLTERKHVYLILHMNRVKETSLVVSHINFLSSWRLTTIDCLDSPKVKLPELCRYSLLGRLKAMRPYTDQITQQLFWVFTRIKYSPNGRKIESIRQIIDKMKSSKTCLQMLEDYLWSIMTSSETDSNDWQLQVACDRHMLHITTGMLDALETYLYNQIRIPLAKVIYKLEVLGALDSFLVDDCDTSPRQYMWVRMMQDDNVFNIRNVPKASGPECYDCNTPDLCYKTPFFKYIHDYLEGEIKRDFTKLIYLLNERLTEENENETPTDDMMEGVKRLQHIKIERCLAIMGNTYTNLCNDYVDDFCNTLAASYNFFSERNRVQITRKLLLQKAHVNIDEFTQSILNIHASVWINPILISTEMQILDICSNIINLDLPDSSHIDGQVGGAKEDTLPEDNSSNEKHRSRCEEPQLFPKDDNALFNSKGEFIGVICKKLLPTSDNITVFHDIITWSGVTGRLLPLMSVVSNESVSLDMLRYCHIIFESLIGPHEMDSELLFKVADEFDESQSFVPESSFQCLMNIVDNAVGAQKSELQRVISDFLINCLFNHSPEGCMTYLYKVILDQKLPDQTCTFLKYLVTLIIQIEAGDIESFIQIIMPEQREVDSTVETDSNETICPFIKSLNEFLTALSSQARSSDPFVLLLVDIFEKEYSVILKKSGKIDASSIFLTANNLIRKYRLDHKLNLTYIASVACYKAFLMEAAANEDIKGYSNAINTIFVQGAHEESMFFFKCLRGEYTSPRLLDVLRRLNSLIPNVESMASSDEAFKNCYDNSPLGNLVSISGLSQEEADKTLIEKSTTSSEAMLAVYHVILKDFYIPRSYSACDDKIKHRAEFLLKCANKSNFPKYNMELMSCLLGRKDFQVSKFMLTQETTSRECLINITLMSLFAILTSRYDHSNPSVFQLCLFDPDKIADRYLPAFPSIVERNIGGLNACVSCNCGYRICLISREDDMKCLVCNKKLNNMASSSTTKLIQNKPGLSYSEEMEKCVYFQRCMSPVACSIVLFLLEGCLLGSHALGILSIDQLKSITNTSQTDTNILDFKNLERHWNNLRLLLNMENYNLFVFLQSFIQNQQSSFTSGNNPFRSPDQRCTWENAFSKAANDSTSNCFGIVGKTISDHAKRYNSIHHDFEVSICECDELNDSSELIYFRMSGKPTRANFIAELFLKANQFPVLDLIIQKEDDIKRVKIINDIIQWHMLIVAETSNRFKKQELLDMTVDKFINSKRDKQKVNLREKFKNLCDAFENENFGQIEWRIKMSECLILDENSQMFLRLKLLVQIQNDIIEEVMCKVPNCKSLHQFRKSDNQVVVQELPVMQVAEKILIGFKSDIDDLILQQSQCDPRYGHGRKMIYDFEKVEKILISDVITGKVYLKLDVCQLPKVVFSDELYRNISLLIDELSQTIGHETLSSDTVATIRKEHTSNPKMVPTLLEHTGMILPLLKITQGEPDNTIKEYTEQWKNIMTVDFPSDLLPSENMKLCHIAALYEFLEELNADAIKDGLGRDYRVELKKPELDGLSKTLNNNSSIAEVLLKVLKRFIHRSLASRDADICVDSSLHAYISDPLLWPSGTVSKGAIKVGTDQCDLTDLLPPRILVGHICCVLDLLHELETNKQQRDDVIKIAKSTERRPASPDTEKNRRRQKARSAMKR